MLTTFAPAENSTFVLNGWFMHTQSQLTNYRNLLYNPYKNKNTGRTIHKEKIYIKQKIKVNGR